MHRGARPLVRVGIINLDLRLWHKFNHHRSWAIWFRSLSKHCARRQTSISTFICHRKTTNRPSFIAAAVFPVRFRISTVCWLLASKRCGFPAICPSRIANISNNMFSTTTACPLVGQRLQVLKDAAKTTFYQALHTCDAGNIANVAHDFGKDLTQLLTRQDFLLSDLVTVMLHDYSTYTHMTHVATYSILLAQKLGNISSADMTEIAKGGLLHDVGKRFISVKILEKPGKLDESEIQIIRDHPRCGFAELCFRTELSWGALMMIYQHHERCNGGGYPVGFVGDEIHPWAKICAIADVYDAMISKRSYHSAAARKDVLDYFQKQAGTTFDKEMVQCFQEIMQPTLLPS